MRSRRTRTFGFAALLVLLGAAPAAAQETQDTTKLPEALRAARATLSAAYAKLDGDAAAAQFATDGTVDFQGQTYPGREAIAGWFAEAFSGLSALRAGTSTFTIAGDSVTERAGYTVVMPDGEQGGTSETVWKRQGDGSWKVARLIVM